MGITTFPYPFSSGSENRQRSKLTQVLWEVLFKKQKPRNYPGIKAYFSSPSVLAKGSLKLETCKGSV